MGDITLERKLEADSEGNLLVSCPKCEGEFKTPIKNIKPGDMVLKEKINCPLCGAELDQVYPDRKTIEEAMKEIGEKFMEDIKKSFKSKEFRIDLKF